MLDTKTTTSIGFVGFYTYNIIMFVFIYPFLDPGKSE